MSTPVLEPVDARMAATMLVDAGRQGLSVVPQGSGTKLEWIRNSAAIGAYLSTKRLNAPIQHFAGDLVATIPSGATLATANAVLAESGQWLPLDPSHAECATIGGIVATNDSGPRRHKHGSPRDLIIGIELALGDGRLAKAGGRVVKNVAGYDLSRLACGSFGSLAVITSATFKLAPLPVASRTIVATCSTVEQAAVLALAIAAQPITPSAVEIRAPSPRLLIRFETTERAADQMAATARAVLNDAGASTILLSDDAEQDIWRKHESSIWDEPGIVMKISVLPTDVETTVGLLANFESRLDWSVVGRAALGVLLVRMNAVDAGQRDVLGRLGRHVAGTGGTVVVLRGPSNQDLQLPGSRMDASLRTVVNAVKARFDPGGVLPALP